MTDVFAPLLTRPEAQEIITSLNQAGFETRFVGGCVRDALLHREIGDIDLATTATPEQVTSILAAKNIQIIPTGIAHGTVTAVLNSIPFEITTLRRDLNTTGRHADVVFGTDWQQDAQRRDFTVNALSLAIDGTLFDYYGGQADLVGHVLRFIDDPAKRMHEDYLRLLRYFRFAAVLDWPLEHQPTLQTCRELAPFLISLSRERIQSELYKILAAPAAWRVCSVMEQYGIWEVFAPQGIDMARAQHIPASDPFLRLLALMGWHDPAALEQFVVLSTVQKRRIAVLLEIDPSRPLHELLYYHGADAVRDYAALHDMDWDVTGWRKPVFPLKAADIMDFAGGPGKQLGEMLRRAEFWWVANKFQPDADQLRAYLSSTSC